MAKFDIHFFLILYSTKICDENDIISELDALSLSQLNSSLRYASVLTITSRMKIYLLFFINCLVNYFIGAGLLLITIK